MGLLGPRRLSAQLKKNFGLREFMREEAEIIFSIRSASIMEDPPVHLSYYVSGLVPDEMRRCVPLTSPPGSVINEPTTDFDFELGKVLNLYRHTVGKFLFSARDEYLLLFAMSAEAGICRSVVCVDPTALVFAGQSPIGTNGKSLASGEQALHGNSIFQVPIDSAGNFFTENNPKMVTMADVSM